MLSGFVAILNLAGAPLDQPLLERMTQALAFRGRTHEGFGVREKVGLGHALLRTTHEATHERQPAALDTHL